MAMNQPMFERPRDTLEGVKGLAFTRSIIARAATGGEDLKTAIAYASARWGADSKPVQILKAEVPAMATGSHSDLLTNGDVAEFVSLVRDRSIIGRLAGLRRRPSKTRIITELTGATAGWVAEGKAIKLVNQTFDQIFTETMKVAAILVVTDELLRSLDPSAELGIRNDLVNAVSEAIDSSFLNPSNAGTAGEEPASVTYGVDPVSNAPGAMDDVRESFAALTANFGGDLESAVVVARPELLVAINAFSFGPFGANVGARGGTIAGIPAIPSKGLPLDAGGKQQLVLIDPTGIIYIADDAATQVAVSRHATIEMLDSNLTGDSIAVVPGTAASTVGLWQTNSVAIRALAYQNWNVARTDSVAVMDGIAIATDIT